MKNTAIAIADDMLLYREGLSLLLKELHYDVVLKTLTVADLTDRLQHCNANCKICLINMNLIAKEGYTIALALKEVFPTVKILCYSFSDASKCSIADNYNSTGIDTMLIGNSTPEDLGRTIMKLYNHQ